MSAEIFFHTMEQRACIYVQCTYISQHIASGNAEVIRCSMSGYTSIIAEQFGVARAAGSFHVHIPTLQSFCPSAQIHIERYHNIHWNNEYAVWLLSVCETLQPVLADDLCRGEFNNLIQQYLDFRSFVVCIISTTVYII